MRDGIDDEQVVESGRGEHPRLPDRRHRQPVRARQVQAGANGLSMATVWEAGVLAAAGFDDLFVVNTVAHPDKIRLLAELARDHRIMVAVDDPGAAAAQSAAAVRAGSA